MSKSRGYCKNPSPGSTNSALLIFTYSQYLLQAIELSFQCSTHSFPNPRQSETLSFPLHCPYGHHIIIKMDHALRICRLTGFCSDKVPVDYHVVPEEDIPPHYLPTWKQQNVDNQSKKLQKYFFVHCYNDLIALIKDGRILSEKKKSSFLFRENFCVAKIADHIGPPVSAARITENQDRMLASLYNWFFKHKLRKQ